MQHCLQQLAKIGPRVKHAIRPRELREHIVRRSQVGTNPIAKFKHRRNRYVRFFAFDCSSRGDTSFKYCFPVRLGESYQRCQLTRVSVQP